MIVLKFGGTSVGKVENIMQVAKLINNDTRKIVVLSAMSGITDKLYEISYYHKLNQLVSANEVIEVVRTRFYSTAELLLTDTKMFDKFIRILDEKIIAINALIHNDYTEIIKNELIICGAILIAFNSSNIGLISDKMTRPIKLPNDSKIKIKCNVFSMIFPKY